ncbi:hypothetical protein BH10PSE18_BH10PSE18_07950 [soil metagenome]
MKFNANKERLQIKGSKIYVEGQICTRKFNKKDGVEKHLAEVRVDRLLMR